MQTQHEDICSKQRCILFYQAGIIERNSFCTLGSVYLQSWIVWGVQSCWRASFYPCENKSSCTSQVCQWQRPRKITNPSSPKKLEDLQFIKTDGVDKEIPQKPYPGVYQASSCSDPDKFLAEVLDGLKQPDLLVYFIKLCLML